MLYQYDNHRNPNVVFKGNVFKMKTRYLIVILLSVTLYGLRGEEEGLIAVKTDGDEQDDQTVVHSFTENEDLDVFKPTSEWQTVKPDQAIPPGLHVKIDLQSGHKQAKLMKADDGIRYGNHEKKKYLKQENQSKQKFIQIDKQLLSKDHLKDALKDFRDKFHDEKPGNEEENQSKQTNKFRPIEEIKQDLEDAHLIVKRDIGVIQEHLQILNSTSSLEEKLHALNELEYYLHQTDNAVDFDTIGGLKLVIKLLNSTDEQLTVTAAYVLGSAVQSNPTVQKAAQKYGALTILLRLLSPHYSMVVRRKALYALSSLIRLCYSAQKEFLKLNGMELLVKLLTEPGTGQLKTKIVTLTTDILTEQFDLVKKKAKQHGAQDIVSILKQVPLLKMMVKQGWCRLVPDLLHTTDNDTREKVLHALNIMAVGCQEQFKKINIFHHLDKLQEEWQAIITDVDNEEGEYFIHLTQLLSELQNKLNGIK